MKSQEREKFLSPFFLSLQRVCILFSFFPAQGVALRCVYFLWTINGAVTPPPHPCVWLSASFSPGAQLPFQGERGAVLFRGVPGAAPSGPRGSGLPATWPTLPRGWPSSWGLRPALPPSLLPGCVSAWAQKRRRLLSGHRGGRALPHRPPKISETSPLPSFRKAGLPLLRHASATHTQVWSPFFTRAYASQSVAG